MGELTTNITSNRMAYLDANAKPLAQGRLMIYRAGSSTELALVYSDAGLAQLLPNPVMLDSSGRAPALYAEGSVHVKVEKYIGEDGRGGKLYALVYDFETPPGIDISSHWNANYVETYEQLRNEVTNGKPTWVTGEGNPHLYVWKASQPSSGLNEVTNVSSAHDPSGSWSWETKEIHADQAGIKRNGTSYEQAIWLKLETLSAQGKKIIIPPGHYLFSGAMPQFTFYDLEIMSGVDFVDLPPRWKIGINRRVECLSLGLPIEWVKLPMDRLYDIKYFAYVSSGHTANESGDADIYRDLSARSISARDNVRAGNNVIAGNNVSATNVSATNVSATNNVSAINDVSATNVKATTVLSSALTLTDVPSGGGNPLRLNYGDFPLAVVSDRQNDPHPVGSYAMYSEQTDPNSAISYAPLPDNYVIVNPQALGGVGRWRVSGSAIKVADTVSYGEPQTYTYHYLLRRVP